MCKYVPKLVLSKAGFCLAQTHPLNSNTPAKYLLSNISCRIAVCCFLFRTIAISVSLH